MSEVGEHLDFKCEQALWEWRGWLDLQANTWLGSGLGKRTRMAGGYGG